MHSESGYAGWLRYATLPEDLRCGATEHSGILIPTIEKSSPIYSAALELQSGISQILGQNIEISNITTNASIILGTCDTYTNTPALEADGFWLNAKSHSVKIIGRNERGVLYGAFEYLSRLTQGNFDDIVLCFNPSAEIRWVDQWDNLDGTIERGYGGKSIFFKDGKVLDDLSRVAQYARLLSSIRLNGIVVNNVNAHHSLLDDDNLTGLGRIADIMRPYGIRIGISLYFDTPKDKGALPTSDPLDPAVRQWWNGMTAKIYQHVPDLLGYTIKANSEGQPGPLSYGRTLADGANMFARALKPHGDGVVMYRAFVYNHHLDESEWTNDRANAAVDYFKPLDAEFDDNVIVQVKYGPIDFQIREPPSPLLAHLKHTAPAMEVMVAQEYLGQQSHYVYMAPLWKTILDFDLRVDGQRSLVRDVLSKRHQKRRSGYVAVVNVGDDDTWLGHHLSMSNLYAYGRLAWNPAEDPGVILRDWIQLTFGGNRTVVNTITRIGMLSWPTYENYSGNLGLQTLCDIIGTHFGPSPGSQDGNGWGQWTRANSTSIGMDRTVASGTGNAGQYPNEVADGFENIETTPDELLLWFHHVPYTHKLKSGKTVIQHIYDAHYEGAAAAQTFAADWQTLAGLVDDGRFSHVARRLTYQAGHSLVWRDSVCQFYLDKCGIPDGHNRVAQHPWRIEAEDMELTGYEVVHVVPSEAASAGRAIVASGKDHGIAQTKSPFPTGVYNLAVNYFDHLGGRSKYTLLVNDKVVGEWKGDLEDDLGHDFSKSLDGHSATRIVFQGVRVTNGDVVKIIGEQDGDERAPLDYISLLPAGVVD